MHAQGLTPILNVSNIQESFAWFEKLGWARGWEWGDPPGFGGVCSGVCEIFLCQNGQGGRGKGDVARTFGPDGDDAADKGVWMTIWVEDVDATYARALAAGATSESQPEDKPYGHRNAGVVDPNGITWWIGSPVK